MKEDNVCSNIKGHTEHGNCHKLLGILLAVAGFFWFAKKAGWIPVAAGGSVVFWPVLTILVGLWIAFGRHRVKARDRKLNIETNRSNEQ